MSEKKGEDITLNMIDLEKLQQSREEEGQDTITPLNNSGFLNTFKKLIRQEESASLPVSSKSSLASSGHSNETEGNVPDQVDDSEKISNTIIPPSLLSIFQTQEEKQCLYQSLNKLNLNSKMDENFFSTNKTDSVHNKSEHETEHKAKGFKSDQNSERRRSSMIKKRFQKLDNINKQRSSKNNNATDDIYEALSLMFMDSNFENVFENPKFVEKLRQFIVDSKAMQKKRLDKVKLLWSIFVYILFFVMFLMISYFIRTLIFIIHHLNENLPLNKYKFNGSSNGVEYISWMSTTSIAFINDTILNTAAATTTTTTATTTIIATNTTLPTSTLSSLNATSMLIDSNITLT